MADKFSSVFTDVNFYQKNITRTYIANNFFDLTRTYIANNF